jgi:hypothetical protein
VNEEFGEIDGSGLVLEVIGERNGFTDACGDAAEAAVDGEGFAGTDLTGGETGEDGVDETAVGDADDGTSGGDFEHIVDGTEHPGGGLRNGFDVARLPFAAGKKAVTFVKSQSGKTAVVAFDEVIEDDGCVDVKGIGDIFCRIIGT